MSLLINESPLQVLPSLASRIGLNEAIVLQQIHFWLIQPHMGTQKDGKKWIRNSFAEWKKTNFPFWSAKTISRIVARLEESNYIVTAQHGGQDRSKWYTINYETLDQSPPRKTKQTARKLPKQKSAIQAMTDMLFEVFQQDVKVVGFKRYLKLAKSLVDGGYSPFQIQEWYGNKDGWWYVEDWRGKQGKPPNQSNLTETIQQAYDFYQLADTPNKAWSPL